MKVILTTEVQGKGGEGDIIDVARGFANNYLLSQGLAVKATPGNLKQLEQKRKNIAKREEVRIADATALKEQLEGVKIAIRAKVGGEGQLFGSVTSQMVADAIKAVKDIDIDRRRITIANPIKTVGEHMVTVDLYRDIKAAVTVNVVDAEAPVVEEAPAAEEVAEEVIEEVVEEVVEEVAESEETADAE